MEPMKADAATRAQLLGHLRRGRNTIEALAEVLGMTDNAVRFHIAILERAKVVRRAGTLRAGRVGKPAVIYELTESAEEMQSRAYAPVLSACVAEVAERLSGDELALFLQSVGHRLASDIPKPDGDLNSRVQHAAEILQTLGGVVDVIPTSEGTLIQGHGCPLAGAVARKPATCTIVRTLLDELIGTPVAEQCEHTERPRCRFLVQSLAPES
jgi:predicted ArsR family transcriptional regulator